MLTGNSGFHQMKLFQDEDPGRTKKIRILYLDIYDELVEQKIYPSIAAMQEYFPFPVRKEILREARNWLWETGEIKKELRGNKRPPGVKVFSSSEDDDTFDVVEDDPEEVAQIEASFKELFPDPAPAKPKRRPTERELILKYRRDLFTVEDSVKRFKRAIKRIKAPSKGACPIVRCDDPDNPRKRYAGVWMHSKDRFAAKGALGIKKYHVGTFRTAYAAAVAREYWIREHQPNENIENFPGQELPPFPHGEQCLRKDIVENRKAMGG